MVLIPRKIEVIDIIWWGLLALFFLWIILKGLGIIGSPQWFDLTLYGLVGLLFLALEYRLEKRIDNRINKIERRIDERMNKIERKIEKIITKLEIICDIAKDMIRK